MVARYPSLLGCSPAKNLAPKFDFFREVRVQSFCLACAPEGRLAGFTPGEENL